MFYYFYYYFYFFHYIPRPQLDNPTARACKDAILWYFLWRRGVQSRLRLRIGWVTARGSLKCFDWRKWRPSFRGGAGRPIDRRQSFPRRPTFLMEIWAFVGRPERCCLRLDLTWDRVGRRRGRGRRYDPCWRGGSRARSVVCHRRRSWSCLTYVTRLRFSFFSFFLSFASSSLFYSQPEQYCNEFCSCDFFYCIINGPNFHWAFISHHVAEYQSVSFLKKKFVLLSDNL